MGSLPGSRGLLAITVTLAAACGGTDKSGLYGPTEAASLRTDVTNIDTPADAGGGGAEGGPSPLPSEPPGKDPGPPPGKGPVVPTNEVPLEPLEPPTPSAPTADAGSPSAPITPDAGSPPSPPPPPPPPPPGPQCGGALLDGVCWYLGELDQTCNTVCAAHGGFDPASATRVGTPAQGGNIEACAALLGALAGQPGVVSEGFREDGLGFGCHLFVDADGASSAWWLTSPAFSPSVANPSARIVCGCVD